MKQMSYKIGVIRGDGIGPEIVAEALKVMNKVADKYACLLYTSDAADEL